MLPELGNFSLMLAFGFSAIQAFFCLIGSKYQNKNWLLLGKTAVTGQLLFVSISFLLLTTSFITNDFSVLYVATNSNSALPLGYRISAVWGAHEGSLLLWAMILCIWTALFSVFSRNLPILFVSKALGVLGIVSFGFLLPQKT